jgi:hypothetical protein
VAAGEHITRAKAVCCSDQAAAHSQHGSPTTPGAMALTAKEPATNAIPDAPKAALQAGRQAGRQAAEVCAAGSRVGVLWPQP